MSVSFNLKFADRVSAIAALAALNLSAEDKDGNAILPSVMYAPDGSRADIDVQGGGTGVVSKPTGATQPGPIPGMQVPVYGPLTGFYLAVHWGGANPPVDALASYVTTDFDAGFLAPGPMIAPRVAPLTFLDFMALFSAADQASVMTARRTDVQVDLFVTMAAGAGEIDLGDTRVIAGVDYLASKNTITAADAARILAGTPPEP